MPCTCSCRFRGTAADSTRSSVATASRAIIDYCNRTGRDIKIYFATYTGLTVVSKETQKSYVSNDSSDEEIEEMLSRSGTASANLDTTNFNYSLTRTLAKSLSEISKGNEDSQKYCFVVDVNFEPQSAADVAVINEMKDYGVDFSFICNDYNSNIANYESLSSDGSHYKWVPDFSDIVIDKVVGAVITYNVNTGLCRKISYNEKFITSEWKDIYEKYYSGKLSADDIKKSGLPDTDGDGAPDCLELFMKLITFDDDGNVILPTYDQVARDSLRNSVWGVKGLDELEDIMREKGIDICNLLILPLISNPTFDDSDYDGIYDMYDEEPVMSSSTDLDVGIIDDTNIFDNGTMTDIRIDENGVFNYENLNGSTTVKKPTVTYTRYADSEKRSLTKFRLLYSGHYSDFKLSVETKYDNDVEVYVYPVDGGTALECEKTKGKNSRENIYGFTTLNNNHGYEKYIPFGWSEEKVPAWMVSSIKPSWAYCVDIYITPREFILEGRNEIKVKFEEDNWIYAPDGGVATSSALNYSALYLPEDALKVIVGKQEADKWEEYILDPAFPRLLRDAITYSYYKEEESHYLNMGEKGFEYKLVSEISTVSTFVGLGCLFASSAIPAEKFAAACTTIGNIATVSGATFTIFSPKNITEQDFRDETEACISEINPSNINLSLHNYDKFDRVGERYDCKEWVNNGYVYKYYYAGRDDSYRIIRTNELKKF